MLGLPGSLFPNSTEKSGSGSQKNSHLLPGRLFLVASSLNMLKGHDRIPSFILIEEAGLLMDYLIAQGQGLS